MTNILNHIAEWKRSETALRKKRVSESELREKEAFSRTGLLLSPKLRLSEKPEIIAEFKRSSPSKGTIKEHADPVKMVECYQQAGAAAVSVLTDQKFFGALPDDFLEARSVLELPLLRKDFILDPYQVIETKSMGADIILLIAAMLSPEEVKDLSGLARSLGMDVLLELHGEEEINRICEDISLLGVNNRNLKSFEVSLEHSMQLSLALKDFKQPLIAESGIRLASDIQLLHQHGFKAFLIGETLMKSEDPAETLLEFRR